MGGGRASYVNSSSEQESLLDQEFSGLSLGLRPTLPRIRSDRSSEKVDDSTSDGENGECDDSYPHISPNSLDFEADQRRRRSVIREISESYEEMRRRSRNLEEAKSKILRSDHSSEKVDASTLNGENGDYDDLQRQSSSNSLDFEADQRQRCSVFTKVLESYNELQHRSENLEAAKSKILSYYPGAWIEDVGGMKMSDYDVPTTTSLLLIGPKGSGKSSLVNRISRVFEDDKFAPDRAQVSYNTSVGDGTYFLQEYMIPRGSTSLCLYDTRSLTGDSSTNMVMLTHWMTRGVRHGELVIRDTDCSMMKTKMKCKARQSGFSSSETRMVNYVIFVVNGVSILKSMYGDDEAAEYMEMVATTFSCPFLSFKDDKPVVVVTHGDLLSLSDRARVRVHLGEMLGISPTKQIFDISESCDLATELAMVDMLRYSLEHADKNLPVKEWFSSKVFRKTLPACLFLLILGIAIIAAHICSTGTHRAPTPSAHMHHTPAPPPPPPPIVHKNPPPQTPPPSAHTHHAPPTAPPSADMHSAPPPSADMNHAPPPSAHKHCPPPASANKRRTPSPSAHMHHAPPTAPPSADMNRAPPPSAHKRHAHKRHARSPSAHRHRAPPIDAGLDWRSTRHLWLGSEYD